MNYIDRYIYAVAEQLPEKMRADVEKELRADIEDMLPENATEEDILNVLTSLGDPKELANRYQPKMRYLISPAVFDDYLATLKLVAVIFATVAAFIGFISNIVEYSAVTPVKDLTVTIISDMIAGVFSGLSAAFLWVTVIFAAIDYSRFKKGVKKETWSPKDLPKIPAAPAARIAKSDAVVEILFSIIFMVIFVFYPHLIGWFTEGDHLQDSIPLFSDSVLSRFIPVIILLTVLTVTIAIFKLVYNRWNYLMAGLNGADKLLKLIFIIVFLNYPGTFNTGFLSRMADKLALDYSAISSDWYRGIQLFIIIVVIASFAGILKGFLKAYKNQKILKQ